MSITAVAAAHITAAGIAGATSSAIDTSTANFIAVAVSYDNTTASPAMTDSKSNTWTALTLQAATSHRIRIYYAWNAIVGTGHTFTHNGVAVGFAVQAFAGVQVSADPFDTQQGAGLLTGTTAGCGTSNLVPSVNNELILSAVGINGSVTNYATAAGFTLTDFLNFSAGSNYGAGLGYLIQTTATTISSATTLASWTTSRNFAEASATFKAAPAGGSVSRRYYFDMIGG